MAEVFFIYKPMVMRGVFAGKPAFFQLMLLLFLILLGGLLSSFLGLGLLSILKGDAVNPMENPEMLRIIQFISALGTFLLPALLMAFFCSNRMSSYLFITRLPGLKAILLTVGSMFLISPFISLTGVLNKMIQLPGFLDPVESWMLQKEEEAERLTTLMLSGDGISTLIQNLFVVAVVAAITEEFLFRGALRRILEKSTANQHLIIWLTAIIFSLFHLQFYGFIPRMLLGAYFGYMLLWGNNIWIPVIAHFTNNFLGVVSLTNPRLSENEYITGNVSPENLLPFAAMALGFLLLFFFCSTSLKKTLTEGDNQRFFLRS